MKYERKAVEMKHNKELLAGIFVIIGIIALSYLTIKLGRMEIGNGDGYELSAQFSSVSGLRTGATVEIAGVRVGRVSDIRLGEDGNSALVIFQVSKQVKLTDDAIVSVRTAGLIGDKYLDIAPGGSGEQLKPGDTIDETESAVDLEALIGKYVFGGVK